MDGQQRFVQLVLISKGQPVMLVKEHVIFAIINLTAQLVLVMKIKPIPDKSH
jgi:hypothetical protein